MALAAVEVKELHGQLGVHAMAESLDAGVLVQSLAQLPEVLRVLQAEQALEAQNFWVFCTPAATKLRRANSPRWLQPPKEPRRSASRHHYLGLLKKPRKKQKNTKGIEKKLEIPRKVP